GFLACGTGFGFECRRTGFGAAVWTTTMTCRLGTALAAGLGAGAGTVTVTTTTRAGRTATVTAALVMATPSSAAEYSSLRRKTPFSISKAIRAYQRVRTAEWAVWPVLAGSGA